MKLILGIITLSFLLKSIALNAKKSADVPLLQESEYLHFKN